MGQWTRPRLSSGVRCPCLLSQSWSSPTVRVYEQTDPNTCLREAAFAPRGGSGRRPVQTRRSPCKAGCTGRGVCFGWEWHPNGKNKLETIQNVIARCLWGQRPKWRSKWLLQAVLATPHRTDPRSACAYNIVFETIRASHSDVNMFHKFQESFEHSVWPEHSLCSRFQQACETLDIQIHAGLKLSFKGSHSVPILDLPRRMLERFSRRSQEMPVII